MSDLEVMEHLTKIIQIQSDIIMQMYGIIKQHEILEGIELASEVKRAEDVRSQLGL